MKNRVVIAVVGKGGSGKTVVTTLLAKSIVKNFKYKLLLIDADPTHPHLSHMVNLIPSKSLESIRTSVIGKTLKKENTAQELAKNIDFEVYNALAESKDFCLFSIGQPEGPGCFCPSNALLRKVIESISKDFEIVLIDCEAGLEQINRMVIEKINILLIVSDTSIRSIETANTLKKNAEQFTKYKKYGIILNRVKGDIDYVIEKLETLHLLLLAKIPEDDVITEYDLKGRPIIDVPENIKSFLAINSLIKNLLETQ